MGGSRNSRRIVLGGLGLAFALAIAAGMARMAPLKMGKQPDGSFIVSTGQRVEAGAIAVAGPPIEQARHPSGAFYAVLNKSAVMLGDASGIRPGSSVPLGSGAGFRGLAWAPHGNRLYASTEKGQVRMFLLEDNKLVPGDRFEIKPEDARGNPVPGGIAFRRDGTRFYVAAANRNAVVEVDAAAARPIREFPVENIPFEPRLTDDDRTLVVSNWGGRLPREGDRTAKSQDLQVVVDERGVLSTGTVSLIDVETGATRHVEVGLHPTGLAIDGRRAYVANAMSDSISEVDIDAGKVLRTIPVHRGDGPIPGSMPNALLIRGKTLYSANGGDNAVAEIDLEAAKVRGYRPAGYFPVAIQLSPDGRTLFALNTKGNGSVNRTVTGKPGNAHDFQGTVTAIDLQADLAAATATVARDNGWGRKPAVPDLKVYKGEIEHVVYIIKENRTYDEVFGDLPIGDGDPALCSLGETVMPNHRKLAREFTLFDNGYVSGTNSADGHNWTTQTLANEYLEHFYVGYSRSYPDDGSDAMALSAGGAIWDAALKKGKSLRVYGEFCDDELNKVTPPPKDWFEVWEDRKNGGGKFTFRSDTRIPSLAPYIHRQYFYWPLWQSDQQRADLFIQEYEEFSKADKVPNLMILSLPCDHGEGTNPKYPTPRAMMADNDLALGRIVEAISNSPQWSKTCIFVIEDDAQAGPDHVDGHRTVFMAISPYTKRKFVDSSFYTTIGMVRSIELMLGLDPMNRFDDLAEPLAACFSDTPDLTPYTKVANNVPLDERNPSGNKLSAADRFWLEKTLALDWSHLDAPDPYWLNRINWYSIHKGKRPYPSRPGEQPGQLADADDD
ncbi:MAG: bifunctional YncE family protein/alkaline phosphatase family protein [Isosphaeraceae bacterium]